METIFTLPLFVVLMVQTFLSLLLLLPKTISLPVSSLFKGVRKSPASSAVVYTVSGALALLSLASLFELLRNNERVRAQGFKGEVLGTVDFLRSQVSFVLSLSNLIVLLLNLALSETTCELASTTLNFEAFKRQVKGLQAAYDSATAKKQDEQGGDSNGEVAALKRQVDNLIKDKSRLEEEAERATKAAKSAEASITAMKAQMKGLDAEYDRILAENKALRLKAGGGDAFQPVSKKDD